MEDAQRLLDIAMRLSVNLTDYENAMRKHAATRKVYVLYCAELQALNSKYWEAIGKLPRDELVRLGMALSTESKYSDLLARDGANTINRNTSKL